MAHLCLNRAKTPSRQGGSCRCPLGSLDPRRPGLGPDPPARKDLLCYQAGDTGLDIISVEAIISNDSINFFIVRVLKVAPVPCEQESHLLASQVISRVEQLIATI